MARSKSSKKWLDEHFNDMYVKEAQRLGYRSRAVFKLKEMQEKDNFLHLNAVVVDLGAAPGGWSAYAHACVGDHGKVIGLDLLPIAPLAGATFIEGDFREDAVLAQLLLALEGRKVDVVMSDMAPNMSGNRAIDIPRSMYLCELALDFAKQNLAPGGALLMKVFHGEGFDTLLQETRAIFDKVVVRKPSASRARSKETYLLAKSYKL